MTAITNRNVIVAGTPGSQLGYLMHCEELVRTHLLAPQEEIQQSYQLFCDHHSISEAAFHPDFYEIPYPGPREYVEFADGKASGRSLVLDARQFSPYLDLWVFAADIVVDIRCSAAEDITAMERRFSREYAQEHVESLRVDCINRYNRHLAMFPYVYTMTSSEISDARHAGLDRFLKSVF